MRTTFANSPSTPPRRYFISTVIALFIVSSLIFLLWQGLQIDQKKIPSKLIGSPAFPFRADWIQGREHLPNALQDHFSLDQFRGKVVVLNFWASWCSSCREEAAELEKFWRENRSRDVFVVGIAIQDTVSEALNFAMNFGKTYILGLDREGRISIDYGVTGVPETFIISKDGIVKHKEIGPVTAQDLHTWVDPLL